MMLDAVEKFEMAFEQMEEDVEEYRCHFGEDDGNGRKPIGLPNSFDWFFLNFSSFSMKQSYNFQVLYLPLLMCFFLNL